MESSLIASKALVQVCVQPQDGSSSYQYTMDLILDKDTFHCKLRTRAQLNDSVKKAFVHLFMDACHVQSLEICDNDEAIPPHVKNALIKRALKTSSDGITVLRFALKSHAPLIVPNFKLHKKSSCADLEALLRIGQCETFKVYVLSTAISRERLSVLCSALTEGTLQPAPEGVISNLYVNAAYRKIVDVDQLWGSAPTGTPPPYDPSTAPGASNEDAAGQSGPQPPTSSRAHGKRRSVSPAVHQTPSKRQLLTEKPVIEPWQLAIAAQGAQIAALSAELSALREQVQQLQQAPVVDAGTQTDPVVEHEPETTLETDLVSSPVYSPAYRPVYSSVYTPTYQSVYSSVYPLMYPPVPHSQATVENTIDERLTMLEENRNERLTKLEQDIINEQSQRSKLDERVAKNNQLVCAHQMVFLFLSLLESSELNHLHPNTHTPSAWR
jgi:hypothetical protein